MLIQGETGFEHRSSSFMHKEASYVNYLNCASL